MAQIKFNQIAQASGKAGGIVHLKNKNSQTMRKMPRIVTKKNSLQQNTKVLFSSVARLWRNIFPEQRQSWIDAASNIFYVNKVGNSSKMRGFQLFSRCNFKLLVNGFDALYSASFDDNFKNIYVSNFEIRHTPYIHTLEAVVVFSKNITPTDVFVVNLFATFRVSEGKSSFVNDFKNIHKLQYSINGNTLSFFFTDDYIARFGITPIYSDTVMFYIEILFASFPFTLKSQIVPMQIMASPTPDTVTDLLAWWNASNVTADIFNLVSQMTDLSGNGYNATQGNLNYKPQLVLNSINGYPVIRFNGSKVLSHLCSFASSTFSIFAVVKMSVNSGNQTIVGLTQGGNALKALSARHASLGVNYGMYCNKYMQSSYSVYNSYNLVCIVVSNISAVNGVLFSTNGVSELATGNGFYSDGIERRGIGGFNPNNDSQFLTGDIAEICVYNRNVTDNERLLVEYYFKSKYDL